MTMRDTVTAARFPRSHTAARIITPNHRRRPHASAGWENDPATPA